MYGTSKRVISDREAAFTSRAFEEFCSEYGIKHVLNSVRHFQSNGQVDRVNGTLIPGLQSNMESDSKWDKHILDVECQLNSAFNKTIGDTPLHVLYGYRLSFRDSALHNVIS